VIWERIKSNWNQYQVRAKEQWSKLSEEQLANLQGSREALASRIREAYGLGAEEAEKQLAGWQALQTDREPSLLRRRT
jgi:uncharacterized protein YjbJ (UPF0337 family)